MEYQSVLKELYSLESPKIKLGLRRIRKLLNKIGNPQKNLKCIHVAGTNGKGSVCAFLHLVLMTAGYKTGLYTSPHLKRFNERIRINDEQISDSDIVRLYKKIRPHITDQSFFEITTAIAFLYFFEKKAEVVVLEVGLGGRLDATNVIIPLVSAITSIGLEHTGILGDSIEKIAYEKSGIIKKGVPVVCGAGGKAASIIKKSACEKKADFVLVPDNSIQFNYNKKKHTWTLDYKKHKSIELKKMKGSYQLKNAAIALEVSDILSTKHNFNLGEKAIQKGISQAAWPGRMDFKGKVLFDCAHNPAGFLVLLKELSYLEYRNLVLVLGFSNDKDIEKISSIVDGRADTVILTQASNPKAADPDEIKKYLATPIVIKNPENALAFAKRIVKKSDLIVVAGSIYMVGELL